MSIPLRRLKIVLLGDAGVGKVGFKQTKEHGRMPSWLTRDNQTSYMQRYSRREFLGVYEPSYNAEIQSIGVQFVRAAKAKHAQLQLTNEVD